MREIIGFDRRYRDGSKKAVFEGKFGLTIPDGWARSPGPGLCPRGAE
jgi:hypothetical protein